MDHGTGDGTTRDGGDLRHPGGAVDDPLDPLHQPRLPAPLAQGVMGAV